MSALDELNERARQEWARAENLDSRLAAAEAKVAALEEALREEWNAPHVLHLAVTGWRLQHPLRCRNNLDGCEWNNWCDEEAEDALAEKGGGFYDLIDHGNESVELRRREGPYDSPLYALASIEEPTRAAAKPRQEGTQE